MSEETCAFCLGGTSEIPPFGTLKDAQDLLHPCATCTLVTHRKCLVDWFNAIPYSQISRDYSDTNLDTNSNIDDSVDPVHGEAEAGAHPGNPLEPEQVVTDISLRSRWFTVLGQYSSGPISSDSISRIEHPMHSDEALPNSGRLLLSAPCPQCKSKITFQIQRLDLLALNNLFRNTISDTVHYSGILLGLSGAATGLVTMGYVGLTRCGVSMIDALVPVSLNFPLFKRNLSSFIGNNLLLAQSLLAQTSYTITRQLKFQHIPLLPVMLFRMRYLLVLDCLFKNKPVALMTDWLGELLICNYVSSLGNHALVRQLYRNIGVVLSSTSRLHKLSLGLLFRGIDWWDPSVMVGATIPARWLYDMVYRFTVNRIHFDLNTSIRPRDIANTLDTQELSNLESLESQLAGLKYFISQRTKHGRGRATKSGVSWVSGLSGMSGLLTEVARIFMDGTFTKLVRLKVLHWFYKSKACMRHDYSSALLSRLVTVTGATTFLWPFIAADLGKLIYGVCLLKVPSLAHIEKDKLVFLSNLLGMALVAFLKDIGNLFMCYQKARQLSNLTVVSLRDSAANLQRPPHQVDYSSRFPGAYEH